MLNVLRWTSVSVLLVLATVRPAVVAADPPCWGPTPVMPPVEASKAQPSKAQPIQTETLYLSVEGMTCADCPPKVQAALKALKSVCASQVSLERNEAVVTVCAGTDTASLLQALATAGFEASVQTETQSLTLKGDAAKDCAKEALQAIASVPGVLEATQDPETGLIALTREKGRADTEHLNQALKPLGMTVELAG